MRQKPRLRQWLPRTATIIGVMGLLTGIPSPITGQTNPTQSAEQSAQLEEAQRLNQQAGELYQQGQYSVAIPLAERALAISEKVVGPEHPNVATSLNNLAGLYRVQGNYAKAEPLYQRALAIREKVLGPEHPDVATSLNNLAGLYRVQGNYAKAEPLYRRAQAIQPAEAEAQWLLQQVIQLNEQGQSAAAIPLAERIIAIQEKVLGPGHPDVAVSLDFLAMLYMKQKNYTEAEPRFQRALAIRKKVLGPEHPDVANSLINLTLLYRAQRNYTLAKTLYQHVLTIQEKVLGPEHPEVATSLNELAELYHEQGNYVEAEPLYQRALAIRKKVLGPEHPEVATSLNNLAELYRVQGNYAKAEPLYQRALAIREKVLGPEHPEVATSLNSLAELYRGQGNYAQAKTLFQRALAIAEKGLNLPKALNLPELVASILNNLALLHLDQGSVTQAESLIQRSLTIKEKVLGPEHPDVATGLNNLAVLYRAQGNYAQAKNLFQRALAILEKVYEPEHPAVATGLNNLASLYWVQGDIIRTTEFLTRGTNIQEQNLALILTTGSEADKLTYMWTLSGTTNANINQHVQSAPDHPQAARLALTTVLRRKGRILDALTDSLQTLRQNLTPEDQKLLNQLAATRSQLAALLFKEAANLSPEQYRSQVASLRAKAEQLESTLARRSAAFRAESQPVTLEAVQRLIPPDAALVELVLYYPFNPKATEPNEWGGAPRYVAYVLHSQGEPKWVDLGAAEPINQAVASFSRVLQNASLSPAEVKQSARKVDEKLMQRIRPLLGNSRSVLLSPDSQLNLIPFAALVDEQNRYLVENYSISYLSSGRDLLRLQSTTSRSQPLVAANPDFDNPGDPTSGQAVSPTRSAANRRSTELAQIQFGALPGTAQEAQAIAPLLPGVKLLTGSQATENAIKQVNGPSILHIASHGFFLSDVEPVAPPNVSVSTLPQRAAIEVVPLPGARPSTVNSENPLLRSGIALAGFNPRQSGDEDGVLTALEVAGLDLNGTKLVVLSACETGVGDVANGEGIYGLRRALAMAGAESQLISLWKVDDLGTKDLMVSYYQRLMDKKTRSEALRQTQLEMLRGSKYQHPFYWAAFIPSGNWTAMESDSSKQVNHRTEQGSDRSNRSAQQRDF